MDRNEEGEFLFIVDSGNPTRMAVGDVVSAVAAGAVNVAAAADGTILVGSVVELLDSNKCPIGAWNSSVSTKYLPASTAGFALVALARPGRRFRCVTNTIITAAAIFATTALVATACDTTLSTSNHIINANDLNTGSDFIILGSENVPTNDITIANGRWIVAFNKGILQGTGKSTGV